MITSIEDARLLKKIKKQDMNAVINWFDTRKSKFYKIGWAYLKNHSDVEDVFHNTIIKVHDKIDQLRDDRFFETWVTSIFLNECRSLYRKGKQNDCRPIPETANETDMDTKLEVINGLEQLDERYREVIILKYLRGYSQEEISEILSMPVGTVKSRIYRGLKQMRLILEGGDKDEM
ncbi:RNA polymerase sigma factor [Cytobacillus purgationiresistens]|uniref:RNA polymerase sigma-70 factor (ECF subfamily) n=1 Tax=Cytobacillus purgationiresistens TaxID=863449 RepID=A0ABU0AR17_9BACI|nr:RNA polymerase sigma factor [Cytobacillus purgationiresistens]MDQ0272853.1 RNA polymerase sigma-70 factor (ECF subfamily) [Cytobacillus purgationiresistens]